jgi:hypothetical protein
MRKTKTFENCQKNAETKGKKNYARNKTSKNLQKLPSWRGQKIPHRRAQIIMRKTKLPKIANITYETKLPKTTKNCQVGGDNKYPTKQSTAKQQNKKI